MSINPDNKLHSNLPIGDKPLLMSPSARHLFNSRLALILTSVAMFVLVCLMYMPHTPLSVLVGLLPDILKATTWAAGAAAFGSVLMRRLAVNGNGLLIFVTATAAGLIVFSLTALALGLLGWLNQIIAISMPAVGAAILTVDLVRNKSRFSWQGIWHSLSRPANEQWLWLIPAVSLATAVVAASVMPGELWRPMDPHPYDVLSYHLQVPREWFEAGRIQPLNHNVFSYFPFMAEMQFLLAMHLCGGPWKAMYVCQYMSVIWSALAVIGIAGAAGNGKRRGSPVVAAAVAASVPWIIMLAGVAYVESLQILFAVLSVGWVLSALDHGNGIKPWLVAGAMAGAACGVKLTAAPMIVAAIPIATAMAWRSAEINKLFIGLAVFVAASALVLSPWLIRNQLWAGNPLFPVAMEELGPGYFSADQVVRFRLAHSPRPEQKSLAARMEILWSEAFVSSQFGYVLWPAALIAAVLAAMRRDRSTSMLSILAIIILAAWLGLTHLIPRFVILAVPVAAVLVGRIEWGRSGIVIALAAATLGWNMVYPRLSATTRDPDRSELIGIKDLSFLTPSEVAKAVADGRDVVLVGDAEAFLYQVPMRLLHYKSVFDVPGGGGG
jgi:hypothetical protein